MKNKFEYLDLKNDLDLTLVFQPSPASDPLQLYVARLDKEEKVNEVYKLVTRWKYRKNSKIKGFVTNKEGKTLVTKFKRNRENILESMIRLHNPPEQDKDDKLLETYFLKELGEEVMKIINEQKSI